MKIKIISILLFTIFSVSCNNSQVSLKKISIIEAIGKERVMNLSEIASEVKYVKLETSPNSLLGNIRIPIFENGYYYLQSINKYCIFNESGKYVGNLGFVGRGPGEYSDINSSKIFLDNETDNVYVFSINKIIEYNKSGKYLREIVLNFLNDKNVIVSNVFRNKNQFIICVFNKNKVSGDIILLDNDGNLLGDFPKDYEKKTEQDSVDDGSAFVMFKSTPIFKEFNNYIRIYDMDNDTIFSYTNGTKTILYVQDFGKYHTPESCNDPDELK